MKTKRSAFNLIELTLAIAVVGIGIASIMALFVPAIDSTKNAIADNYAPDVVNTFVAYLTASLKRDNTSWNNGMNSSSSIFYGGKIYKESEPFDTKELENITYDPVKEWSPVNNFKGLYTTHTKGVFGVKTEGEEFAGHLCVWVEEIHDLYNPKTENYQTIPTSGSTPQAVRIYFELSWPAGNPSYETRERRLYSIELFNDNAP